MWKGGRRKLEKAKEHYLLKLKHGWQEESELASKASESVNVDASKSQNSNMVLLFVIFRTKF
ncbi:hypothetical protein CTI12_AA035200 [Artemisia annua]|uniref:Uncharacterized protein n=1 Tax=Artemisia annua TaxID=35608 RepID=A0A2U1QFW3_ARTAN|nr:hypothetical protein CTI12_AA035200 [Artemisia annua]